MYGQTDHTQQNNARESKIRQINHKPNKLPIKNNKNKIKRISKEKVTKNQQTSKHKENIMFSKPLRKQKTPE